MNAWFIARLLGALRLNKEYNESMKLYPTSYYYLSLVIISDFELEVLLNAIDISDLTNHLAKFNNNEFKK